MNLKEIINGLFKNSQNYKTKNEEVCDLSGFNQVKINNAIRNFFPETGVWYSNCYLKPTALNIDNLPCHLRDYNWMAQMLQKKAELDNVDIDVLEGYITNSALFNSLKDKYEKKIVKWQINYMISGGTNWRDEIQVVGKLYKGFIDDEDEISSSEMFEDEDFPRLLFRK